MIIDFENKKLIDDQLTCILLFTVTHQGLDEFDTRKRSLQFINNCLSIVDDSGVMVLAMIHGIKKKQVLRVLRIITADWSNLDV